MRRLASSALTPVLFVLTLTPVYGQTTFYSYYASGTDYIEKRDWLRAIEELRSAASLEFEDTDMKRIYGTRFIEYFPHRELGVAYYNLKEFESARKELELSLAYTSSGRAEEYLRLVTNRTPPDAAAAARRETADTAPGQRVETEQVVSAVEPVSATVPPAGALAYDPMKVRQVGGRLTLAVLPFQGNGENPQYVDVATDRMVTQLVALRRFKVIERTKLEDLLEEQRLQVSGIVDDRAAVDVGRVAGADAIVAGNVSVVGSAITVGTRVIDTQSSEVLVARTMRAQGTRVEDVEKLVSEVAIMVYNDLPLVQGSVINTEGKVMYLDMGRDTRIRRGSRCVAYREVGDLLDPTTGTLIDKKVKLLGEIQIQEVLDRASKAELVRMEPGEVIKVGDKIVVK